MNKVKKLVPKLRFPEFTDAWEQRKLGDVANSIKSYPLSRNVETEERTNTKYIHYGDIHRGIANILDDINILPNIIGEYTEFLNFGDIVVADASEDYYGVASPCVVNCFSRENIVAGLHTIAIRPYKSHHLFLYYLLYSSSFKEYCKKVGTGTKVFSITSKNLLSFESFFPPYKEQQKIGNFFTLLDRYITIHQRKLENVKKLKKSLLQKMFPKSNQTFPELRFPEFTDAWEQRKLGEIGTTFTGLSGKTKDDFGHGNAKFITYLNVFNNPISDLNGVDSIEIDTKQNSVKYGDILFTTSSETPNEVGMSSVWLDNAENIYLNSFCFGYRLKEKLDLYFLAFLLRSPMIRQKFTLLAQGISRYNISKTRVMEMDISYPELKEQQKIGNFFTLLDRYITIHQRKVENLQNLKKSLLQQMFV
ncbi:restriction endonuclease subunit S [Pelistega ratti]|uniref:restriction endonuclease subunit S n=1 Tax=Pelistega ratti TaxID=2652177 RepID=UPI001359EF9A|nr:restriction endonuclease subunit S [Pelistega ratti]